MTDPRDFDQNDAHPASGHRTPREITSDEAGPIGGSLAYLQKKLRADDGLLRPVDKSPDRAPESNPGSEDRVESA